jgi:predicted lipoprotein with Yx(FWY)xxD motif
MNPRPAASLAVLTLVASLAACSGGGGTGAGSGATPVTPGTMNAPTTPSSTSSLSTARLNGSPGFINAAGFTVYVFDADQKAPGASQCTAACAGVWPAVTVASGTALSSGFSTITRSDTGAQQLAFGGRPLYTFTGDQAPVQTNGDGITSFGAAWHVARPSTSATSAPATSQPSSSPSTSPGGPLNPYAD